MTAMKQEDMSGRVHNNGQLKYFTNVFQGR